MLQLQFMKQEHRSSDQPGHTHVGS